MTSGIFYAAVYVDWARVRLPASQDWACDVRAVWQRARTSYPWQIKLVRASSTDCYVWEVELNWEYLNTFSINTFFFLDVTSNYNLFSRQIIWIWF